ncbi:hypothetical protein EXIGLDRAFT_781858 [Exidia glandulosa HHB12029]|uniref:Uncharacterized protein n=1 Tax=Exidia glandulosa HHB12029 TaxID=1314781 RepID=A0A165B489_EXIGL|nr:hypothetical protein EXIGLDRAFT_781858 [Exidia glandulosa HHB12029]
MSTVIVPSDDRWSAPKASGQALPAPAKQVFEQSGCGESYPVDVRGAQAVIRLSSTRLTLTWSEGTGVTIYGYARTNATNVLHAAEYTLDASTASARGSQYIPVKLPASSYNICDPVILRLTGLWAEQSHVLQLNVATSPSWAEPMATDIVIYNATVEDARDRITTTTILRTAASMNPTDNALPSPASVTAASIDASQPSSTRSTTADQTSNGHKPQKTLVLVGPGLIVILIIAFTARWLVRRRRSLQAVNAASEIIKPYGMSPGDACDVESVHAHPRRTVDLPAKLVAVKQLAPSVPDSMSAHVRLDALSPISHAATVGMDEPLHDRDGIAPVYDADIHVALDDAVRRAGFSMGALLASLQRVHNNGAETDVESAVPPMYDGASR